MRIKNETYHKLVATESAALDKVLITTKPAIPPAPEKEPESPKRTDPVPTVPEPGTGSPLPPGVARGLENEHAVLVSLHDFGWITARQAGELVWRKSTYSVQMARRVLRRMAQKRLVIERKLPNGTSAWVLSSGGAQRLQEAGIEAKRGTDQLRAADESTWLHRWLVNEFLIAKAPEGVTTYSEYAILAHRGPLPLTDTPYGRLPARQWLGKVPDALWARQADDVQLLTWIEMERTRKRTRDLRQLCEFIVRGMHQPVIAHSEIELEQIFLLYAWDSQRPETRPLVYPLVRALMRGLRKAVAEHFANYDASVATLYAEQMFEHVYLVLLDVGPGPLLREVREGWRVVDLWLDPDLSQLKQALGVGTPGKSRRR